MWCSSCTAQTSWNAWELGTTTTTTTTTTGYNFCCCLFFNIQSRFVRLFPIGSCLKSRKWTCQMSIKWILTSLEWTLRMSPMPPPFLSPWFNVVTIHILSEVQTRSSTSVTSTEKKKIHIGDTSVDMLLILIEAHFQAIKAWDGRELLWEVSIRKI